MGKTLLEKIYWREPPPPTKTLYYERRRGGVILNCQILAGKDFASVRGDDAELERRFYCLEKSEAMAIEYVEQRGYIPACDWALPPPPMT